MCFFFKKDSLKRVFVLNDSGESPKYYRELYKFAYL